MAYSRGDPYRSIAALELFGSLLCILVFADEWPVASTGKIRLAGSTDNLGNAWIVSRLMSSKFPMLLVLGELAVQIQERHLELSLEWVPRLQNEEADALTNGDFSAFSLERRVVVEPETLAFRILPKLVEVAESLRNEIVARRAVGRPLGEVSKRRKLRETDPWR